MKARSGPGGFSRAKSRAISRSIRPAGLNSCSTKDSESTGPQYFLRRCGACRSCLGDTQNDLLNNRWVVSCRMSCALHFGTLFTHTGRSAACPFAAKKMATYRSRRSSNRQRPCHRQAHRPYQLNWLCGSGPQAPARSSANGTHSDAFRSKMKQGYDHRTCARADLAKALGSR